MCYFLGCRTPEKSGKFCIYTHLDILLFYMFFHICSTCQCDFLLHFYQPLNNELLGVLTPVAFCHALGHVMSNVSFAAVAVSFTHTVKGLSFISPIIIFFNEKMPKNTPNLLGIYWMMNVVFMFRCDNFEAVTHFVVVFSLGALLQCCRFSVYSWTTNPFHTLAFSCSSRVR